MKVRVQNSQEARGASNAKGSEKVRVQNTVKRLGASNAKVVRRWMVRTKKLFSFFIYFDLQRFLLIETSINFITQNILRRFSITVLECAS